MDANKPSAQQNDVTAFLRKREFGFLCPAFSLGRSGDGFLLPKSLNQFLTRSLLGKKVATRDLTGRYTLELHHEGATFCTVPVIVTWARHRSQPQPFLALKVDHHRKLRRALHFLAGRDVELCFKPRLPSNMLRPALGSFR